MIELLERPCFNGAIYNSFNENMIVPCWGLENKDRCPNYDSTFDEANRGKWEVCGYGKLNHYYPSYLARRTDCLRNYFAKGVMESLIRKLHIESIFEESIFEDCKVKESNVVGISKVCFKVADLMIKAKFEDQKERQERDKTRKLEVDD
jgi:hypothetical protein